MTMRPFTIALAVASLAALATTWATGCENDMPRGSETVQVESVKTVDQPGEKESDHELTSGEQQALKNQFSAQAEREITPENVEALYEQLEREIEAESTAE